MKKKSIFAALVTLVLYAFSAWIFGYSFDYRWSENTFWAVTACFAAFLVANIVEDLS